MAKKQFNPVIPDYRPKTERLQVVDIPRRTCLICNKVTQGYGSWHEGYTCSRACEAVKEMQPRNFGEHHEKPPLLPGDGGTVSDHANGSKSPIA